MRQGVKRFEIERIGNCHRQGDAIVQHGNHPVTPCHLLGDCFENAGRELQFFQSHVFETGVGCEDLGDGFLGNIPAVKQMFDQGFSATQRGVGCLDISWLTVPASTSNSAIYSSLENTVGGRRGLSPLASRLRQVEGRLSDVRGACQPAKPEAGKLPRQTPEPAWPPRSPPHPMAGHHSQSQCLGITCCRASAVWALRVR